MPETTRSYPNRIKSNAVITDEHGQTRERMGYKVAGRTAILREGGRLIIERTDVANFERVPPFQGKYHWVLTFENGDTWTIEDKGGCGCGGGR